MSSRWMKKFLAATLAYAIALMSAGGGSSLIFAAGGEKTEAPGRAVQERELGSIREHGSLRSDTDLGPAELQPTDAAQADAAQADAALDRGVAAERAVAAGLTQTTREIAPAIAAAGNVDAPAGDARDAGEQAFLPLAEDNPFSKPSPLQFQYPQFDRIQESHFRPAFEAGMAEHRKEVDAIAHNPEPPTFENTLTALERAGQLLDRVSTVFFNLASSNTSDELQKIESEMAPRFSAHQDTITLDPALFARIEALHASRESLGLDPESAQLLERSYQGYVRSGAKLSDPDKASLKKINEEVSSLTTQFVQNVRKATNEGAVVVDDVAQLDGLPAEQIAAAAETAKERGLDGKWVIDLQNTTTQPVLELLTNRALRERIYQASIERAAGGDADNSAVVARMAKLLAQKAALMGEPNYAAFVLAGEVAGTTAYVNKMLTDIGGMALPKAQEEASDNQKLIDTQAHETGKAPFAMQPWDWAFYARQVRKARFAFDDADVKPYFELNRVLQDGVFHAANLLYGITFKERHDLPVYQPDVRVFEVFDADGSSLGLLLRDDFKRDNKSGGAWMNSFVSQSELLGHQPVVSNNLNITKPAAGQPALLTFDEVTTMFHEFGHALHGLFSRVKYPSLSGTNVPNDFVEYPSQFNEMFSRVPEIVANFAKHYQTGEAMPRDLLDRVIAAQTFGTGFDTTEYLAAAILDQEWHQIAASQAPDASNVMAFEREALAKHLLSSGPVPPRYHTLYFAHAFGGGYDGRYVSYIVAETFARATGAWLYRHGGITRANGGRLRSKVLSRGRSEEPEPMFEDFYGGPPEIEPLIEYRGLGQSKH